MRINAYYAYKYILCILWHLWFHCQDSNFQATRTSLHCNLKILMILKVVQCSLQWLGRCQCLACSSPGQEYCQCSRHPQTRSGTINMWNMYYMHNISLYIFYIFCIFCILNLNLLFIIMLYWALCVFITPTTTGQTGYQYRCVITNAAGASNSLGAILTVTWYATRLPSKIV